MSIRYSPRNCQTDNLNGLSVKRLGGSETIRVRETGQYRVNNVAFSNGKMSKKMCLCTNILPYTYPYLQEGKDWCVVFYAKDPASGKMRRKRYKVNFIKGAKERRRYARRMIFELMAMLDKGWNPWAPANPEVIPVQFGEACDQYLEYIGARERKGTLRPDSAKSYRSCLSVFRDWCVSRAQPLTVCSQFTKAVCAEFLDYIYIKKNVSAVRRNTYLVWMSGFFGWMVEHGILQSKPCEGIKALPKDKEAKSRALIPEKELGRLRDYLAAHNRHYLLAVYLLYYCFIRPKEMMMLRIRDFSLIKGVVKIPGNVSKNGRDGSVTLPAKVVHYMIDLGIFDSPGHYYLFSDDWMPGTEPRKPKAMYDWWIYHVARDLRWPKEYQLYSLKDTGITRLLHRVDALAVRDQARHSDISITNIYAQRSEEANEALRNIDDVL